MKTLLITIIILSLIAFLFQLYIIMSARKIETQPYKVLQEDGRFEIRHYPSATMAKVSSRLKSYRDLGYSGFGKLAKYIFGGNDENKKIAMTSPVHMEIGDSESSMSFVMPSNFNVENLPKPKNNEIVIEKTEPVYAAVLKFGGFANTTTINAQKAILEKSLIDKGISYYGNFRYLGYNPPYQLVGRRNEVVVNIHWE